MSGLRPMTASDLNVSNQGTKRLSENSEFFVCMNCNGRFNVDFVFIMADSCQHRFCRLCTQTFLSSWQVLRCPLYPQCKAKMSLDDASLIIPESELFDMIDTAEDDLSGDDSSVDVLEQEPSPNVQQEAVRKNVHPIDPQSQDTNSRLTPTSLPGTRATKEFRCKSCHYYFPIDFIFKTSVCDHYFCRQCALKYVTEKISNRQCPIECPVSSCKEVIPPDDICLIAEADNASWYEEVMNSRHCREESASGIALEPESRLPRNGNFQPDVFMCDDCKNIHPIDFVFNVGRACQHQLCRSCAIDTVNLASRNVRSSSKSSIRCPVKGCKALMDAESIELILDFEDLHIFGLAPQTFECRVCLDQHVVDDLFKPRECSHEMCRDCARNYFKSLADDQKTLSCPETDCPGTFSLEDAAIVVDKEEYERLSSMLFRKAVSGFATCPKPDCNGLAELVPPNYRFTCPVCSYDMCFRCKKDWHVAVTCEEYAQWQIENGRADAEFDRYVADKKVQVCPSCRNGVEKREGCNHMECRCGCHFCYICGENFPGGNLGQHFISKCPLFNYPESD